MATRGTIAMVRNDGMVIQVYSHWDNYLENNGDLLIKYYNTADKVEELLSYGNISSLGKVIGEKHPFDTYDLSKLSAEDLELAERAKREEWTLYYGRDRGEDGTQARVFKDVEAYEKAGDSGGFEEYNYLFIGGRWYYKSYDGLVRDVEKQLVINRLKEAA
jgi:hypothetical protein